MENEIKENETEEIIELNDNIFYSPKEFSKLRHCSILNIYNLSDFPSENYGKEKVALGSAIRIWYNQRRTKDY